MIRSVFQYILCFGFILSFTGSLTAQLRPQTIRGRVVDLSNQRPIEAAHVVNMATYKGTTTNDNGFFSVSTSVGDTLYVSILSYKSLNIVVAPSMLKREYTTFYVIPSSYELSEMVVRSNYLTGILEVDVRSLDPIFVDKIVSMSGVKSSSQINNRTSIPTPLNPVEFVASFFSKEKKLKRLKEETEIADMLAEKYDREFLKQSLGITKEQLEELLLHCSQDPKWVLRASDLEILNALLECQKDLQAKQTKSTNK